MLRGSRPDHVEYTTLVDLKGACPSSILKDSSSRKSAERMMPDDFDSETKRCGLGLTEKGRQITRIGNDIAERERRVLEKPASPANPIK